MSQYKSSRAGLTNSDLYYQYNCRARTVEILELPDCWTDIPVKGGGFVDPHSCLFIVHSSKVACNRFFPVTVQAIEGWVTIMPHLVWQPEPNNLTTQKATERTPLDLEAKGLTIWTEDQGLQDRF